MRRVFPILLVILLLCGCGTAAKTWQEEYDLGVRYLSEGNYEEAILAFEAAIEIDPKRAEAYLSLVDVYVAQGDLDAAREVLDRAVEAMGENEAILAKIEEVAAGDPNAGGRTGPDGNARTVARTERYDSEDGSYQIYEFDADDLPITSSYYSADGSYQIDNFDADGHIVSGTSYAADGSVQMYREYEVDGNGNTIRQTNYEADGSLVSWVESEYDGGGNLLRTSEYLADGTLYCVTDCDPQAHQVIRATYYDPDGTVRQVQDYTG